jgi:F0F1-type ATP synthase gamma subunit
MQIKKTKKIMQVVEQAICVSSNVLSVARASIRNSKKRIACFEKAIEVCGLVSETQKIPITDAISVVLFSDIGFCGPFNKCPKEFLNEKLCMGKKAPYKTLNLHDAVHDEKALNDFLGDFYNIHVYVKNFKTQEFDIFNFPGEYKNTSQVLVSSDKDFAPLYRRYFMEYCINVAIFNENNYRVGFMNNALENCKNQKRKLRLQFSKCRQESINSEIAISTLIAE